MAAKNFLVDDGSNRQTVETVRERLPESNVVPSFALIIESIDTIDAGTLVIAP